MIPPEDVSKITERVKGVESDIDEFFEDVGNSLMTELYGWVEVSTGEFIHTKPSKYNWDSV